VIDAIFVSGYRKTLLLWSRRAGKDICAWNIAIRQCLEKVCIVYYCLPTYNQARRVIWEGIALNGKSFLSFIPKELIAGLNASQLKVTFTNGSILCLIGASSFDNSTVGTNVYLLVISEAALMPNLDKVWDFFRPIIAYNGGSVIIVSTPRGKNEFFHMYTEATENPDWFVSRLTARETKHIPDDVLAKEEAETDPGLFAQEWLCDFNRGQQGLVYGANLDKMKADGRFTIVNHDPLLLTHVVMDLGMTKDNTTCLLFFQVPDSQAAIFIIDCYSACDIGLDTYSQIIKKKSIELGYNIGTIYCPHDMEVRENSNAMSRLIKFRDLGNDAIPLKQHGLEDGIDNVASVFQKIWINSLKCQPFMDALENYRRLWDEERRIYKEPIHNWASNYADALRYLAASLHLLAPKKSLDEINRIRRQALYGGKATRLPQQFTKW
jgi:hypothetical protein